MWVHADVVNLETGTEQRTNDFRFTWCRENGPPLKRMVVPKTYGGKSAFAWCPMNINEVRLTDLGMWCRGDAVDRRTARAGDGRRDTEAAQEGIG